MSDTLKGLLIIASVLTVGWILRKIRKNKVKMEDAIFWIFFAAILLLLAIFPEISWKTRLECYLQKLRFVPRLRIRRLIK